MYRLLICIVICLSWITSAWSQQDFVTAYLSDFETNRTVKSKDWKNDSIIKYYDTAWKQVKKDKANYLLIAYHNEGVYTTTEYNLNTNQPIRKFYYTDQELKNRISTGTLYHGLNTIKATVPYKNGVKNGLLKGYQANGSLTDSLTFSNNILVGRGLLKYESGQKKLELDLNDQGAGTVSAYYPNGHLYYTGTYDNNNIKSGLWKYYDDNNILLYSLKYTNGKLTTRECFDNQGAAMKECIDFQLPQYPGGVARLSQFISENFQNHDRRKRGKIVVKFLIDKHGQVDYKNVEYLETIGEDFHEAVEYLLSLMPKWHPAILENRPVDCYYTLPLTIKDDARFYHPE